MQIGNPAAVQTETLPGNDAWRVNLGRQDDAELVGPRPDWWWTGRPPTPGRCPGVDLDGKLTSLPLPNLQRPSRESALAYFDNTWTLTEVFFAALRAEEAFYRPPYHNLRHPLIFYYAHPAVLYVNKLRVAGLLDGPVDPEHEALFETGVDEMSWDDMSKNEKHWPSVREVNAYRAKVYKVVRGIIETHPGLATGAPEVTLDAPLWALYMGFEHERIHLETSSVLIRELPLSLVQPPGNLLAPHPNTTREAPGLEMIAIAAAVTTLGKPLGWPSFGWDNEYGHRNVEVPAFEVSRTLTSNGDFLAFVQAGGYREARYWSPEGWAWRTFRNVKWPAFWVPDGPAGLHRFELRTCFEQVPLPLSWPAVVNYYEAKAYAAWRSEQTGTTFRLPTEAEHHLMRDPARHNPSLGPDGDPTMLVDGHGMLSLYGQNLSFAHGSEGPVNLGKPTAAGLYDVFGNVWQWLEDTFQPLDGFAMHPYYEDFSMPCFDDRHHMMLGGSFASTGDEASIFARYHFRPHFHQHAGVRLVRGESKPAKIDVYETQQTLNEYLTLHFGAPEDQMPFAFGPHDAIDFPVRCARLVTDALPKSSRTAGRALDLGCAVGRSTFELARDFQEVVGIDLSRAFIETAQTLARDGKLAYERRDEGALVTPREAVVDPAIDRARVTFQQGDACNLPPELGDFDAVLLANLLCRLPDARPLLARLAGPQGLVKPGGLVVMVSPYSWLPNFTPREAWLGGFERDGVPVGASDTLRALLAPDFELLSDSDVPLVIREHARKFQYIVSNALVWRRRA